MDSWTDAILPLLSLLGWVCITYVAARRGVRDELRAQAETARDDATRVVGTQRTEPTP